MKFTKLIAAWLLVFGIASAHAENYYTANRGAVPFLIGQTSGNIVGYINANQREVSLFGTPINPTNAGQLQLPITSGGTGATTQQGAITNLTGTQVSGYYLRSNGTNASLSAIQAGDVPTLNQNTTGSAGSLSPGNTINGVNFTGASPITVTAAAGTLTGTTLNSTVVNSSLTSLGTITSLIAGAIRDTALSTAGTVVNDASGNLTSVAILPAAKGGTGCSGTRLVASGTSDTDASTACAVKWTSASTAAKAEVIPACNGSTTKLYMEVTDGTGNAGQYSITISAASGTINGTTNTILNQPRGTVHLRCDGVSDWSAS